MRLWNVKKDLRMIYSGVSPLSGWMMILITKLKKKGNKEVVSTSVYNVTQSVD